MRARTRGVVFHLLGQTISNDKNQSDKFHFQQKDVVETMGIIMGVFGHVFHVQPPHMNPLLL